MIENQEQLNELFSNQDFARMWLKMHTPHQHAYPKIRRNEICPFCDSGKKFKNCECYEQYGKMKYITKYDKEED